MAYRWRHAVLDVAQGGGVALGSALGPIAVIDMLVTEVQAVEDLPHGIDAGVEVFGMALHGGEQLVAVVRHGLDSECMACRNAVRLFPCVPVIEIVGDFGGCQKALGFFSQVGGFLMQLGQLVVGQNNRHGQNSLCKCLGVKAARRGGGRRWCRP